MDKILNPNAIYELTKLMTINELVFFMRNMPEYANSEETSESSKNPIEKILLSNAVWIPKIKEYMLLKKDEESMLQNGYKFIKEHWNLPYKRYYFEDTKSGAKLLRNKQIYYTINGKVSRVDQNLIPMQRDILNLYSSMHYFAIYVDNPKGVYVTSSGNSFPDENELPDGDDALLDDASEHIRLKEIDELKGLELKYVHYSFDTMIFLTNKGLFMYEHEVGCGEIRLSSIISPNPDECDDGQIIDLELGDRDQWAHIVSNNNQDVGVRMGPFMLPRNRQQYPQYILKTKTKKYRGYIGNFPGTDNNLLAIPF